MKVGRGRLALTIGATVGRDRRCHRAGRRQRRRGRQGADASRRSSRSPRWSCCTWSRWSCAPRPGACAWPPPTRRSSGAGCTSTSSLRFLADTTVPTYIGAWVRIAILRKLGGDRTPTIGQMITADGTLLIVEAFITVGLLMACCALAGLSLYWPLLFAAIAAAAMLGVHVARRRFADRAWVRSFDVLSHARHRVTLTVLLFFVLVDPAGAVLDRARGRRPGRERARVAAHVRDDQRHQRAAGRPRPGVGRRDRVGLRPRGRGRRHGVRAGAGRDGVRGRRGLLDLGRRARSCASAAPRPRPSRPAAKRRRSPAAAPPEPVERGREDVDGAHRALFDRRADASGVVMCARCSEPCAEKCSGRS